MTNLPRNTFNNNLYWRTLYAVINEKKHRTETGELEKNIFIHTIIFSVLRRPQFEREGILYMGSIVWGTEPLKAIFKKAYIKVY